jgi:hypothetical protein
MVLAVDPSVTAGLVAAAVSIAALIADKLWLARRAQREDLATQYRHDERKELQALIARYHGGLLEHATGWNYRMFNLFGRAGNRWLERNGEYRDESHYYFHSSAYRFLALLTLAQQFESEQIFIDARYVEERELDFVKFVKAFHWVMSDVALYRGIAYDEEAGPDHFMSDRLRAICEAFAEEQRAPSFRQFEARVLRPGVHEPELDLVFQFFDGLSPNKHPLRWDRLICLHLLATAFVTTFGYDWQRPKARHITTALGQIQRKQVFENFVDWLPRLGLDQQECLLEVRRLAEDPKDPSHLPRQSSPERIDVAVPARADD